MFLIQFVHSSDYLEIKIKARSVVSSQTSQWLWCHPQCLGNHNVQVFPVSSTPVQTGEERGWLTATLVPGWWTTSQATQHSPPVGPTVNSQMGKHPSSWSSSLYLSSIKSTQLEVVVKEIQFYRSIDPTPPTLQYREISCGDARLGRREFMIR